MQYPFSLIGNPYDEALGSESADVKLQLPDKTER